MSDHTVKLDGAEALRLAVKAQGALERCRARMAEAQRARGNAFAAANAAGVSQGDLASATGLTKARVWQLIDGAK